MVLSIGTLDSYEITGLLGKGVGVVYKTQTA
jgi:hypothetical protein